MKVANKKDVHMWVRIYSVWALSAKKPKCLYERAVVCLTNKVYNFNSVCEKDLYSISSWSAVQIGKTYELFW